MHGSTVLLRIDRNNHLQLKITPPSICILWQRTNWLYLYWHLIAVTMLPPTRRSCTWVYKLWPTSARVCYPSFLRSDMQAVCDNANANWTLSMSILLTLEHLCTKIFTIELLQWSLRTNPQIKGWRKVSKIWEGLFNCLFGCKSSPISRNVH